MADNEWKKVEMGEAWDFEKDGKELIGTLTEVQHDVGPNNSKLYTLEKIGDGKKVDVWGSSVIDIRMKNVVVGEEVKIIFLGKEKSEKTGRTYKNFDIFHRQSSFEKANDEEIPVDEEIPF